MDVSDANSLLRTYLEGNASPEEIQLVEQWYQHLADAGEWNWAKGEKESLEGIIESRLLQQIRAAEPPWRKRRAVSWIAAAVFILLAGAASWLFVISRKKEPPG